MTFVARLMLFVVHRHPQLEGIGPDQFLDELCGYRIKRF